MGTSPAPPDDGDVSGRPPVVVVTVAPLPGPPPPAVDLTTESAGHRRPGRAGARDRARALAELVRLPAVLTVPGDSLVGAVASGRPATPAQRIGLAGAGSLLYLAGMALNDWADRGTDAVERPGRPLPSGRVEPAVALVLALGLTGAGVAGAAAAGGRRAAAVATALAGAVWAYDLHLKDTGARPLAMAACRGLDVLLGAAPGRLGPAVPPALAVGGHAALISSVSAHEADAAAHPSPVAPALGTAAVTALAAGHALRHGLRTSGARRAATAAPMMAAYTAVLARAGADLRRDPGPATAQRFVGAGVLATILLQAGLLHGAGAPLAGGAVGALWPLARRLTRARSVT